MKMSKCAEDIYMMKMSVDVLKRFRRWGFLCDGDVYVVKIFYMIRMSVMVRFT